MNYFSTNKSSEKFDFLKESGIKSLINDAKDALECVCSEMENLRKTIRSLSKQSVAKKNITQSKNTVPKGYMPVKEFEKKYMFVSDTCINHIINEYSIDFSKVGRNKCFCVKQFMRILLKEGSDYPRVREKLKKFRQLLPELELLARECSE